MLYVDSREKKGLTQGGCTSRKDERSVVVGSPNVTTNTEDTSKGYGHTRDVTIDVMAMSKATAAATARSQQTPTRKAAEQGKQKQTRNAQRKRFPARSHTGTKIL